ncbi:septation protein SepH [Zhihengliuella salsuginis]|uniref:DUF3071 domain-containing protein n=1 Tax=Zhihengliuella salsuginis TaxID=578222 RepID=A0ABQ3GEI7_9MICC|nr:septation protein SepH [Zhihengliuella salsuginis]GHD01171.1 hypothetical protein GCM10008096_04980 [Zhihengliuella salsuginis]
MQQLRLVGVHEDGEHLLVASDEGATYQLPLDEALRAAATRPTGRTAAGQAADSEPRPLSPREIQARVRSGASAEDLADETGLPLDGIMRYAGAVYAEREFVAQQARSIEVSGPQGHDAYRSAFGDEPATLGDMVNVRLASFGVQPDAVEWDAARRSDGAWDVTARFDSPEGSGRAAIGEEPPARWVFHPARKLLQNTNRWSQVLSELEPLDSPLTARRLTAVKDRPFDVEADEEPEAPSAESAVSPGDETDESRAQEEFLDILRSRRGQRLGEDEDGDDTLATMLTQGVPAAHPRDEDFADADEARRLGFADDEADEEVPRLHDGVSTETSEVTVVPNLRALRFADHAPADETAAGDEDPDGHDDPGPKRQKPKRSSVPSWDEIVFGKKSD